MRVRNIKARITIIAQYIVCCDRDLRLWIDLYIQYYLNAVLTLGISVVRVDMWGEGVNYRLNIIRGIGQVVYECSYSR